MILAINVIVTTIMMSITIAVSTITLCTKQVMELCFFDVQTLRSNGTFGSGHLVNAKQVQHGSLLVKTLDVDSSTSGH